MVKSVSDFVMLCVLLWLTWNVQAGFFRALSKVEYGFSVLVFILL